jgi:hypothetical protein
VEPKVFKILGIILIVLGLSIIMFTVFLNGNICQQAKDQYDKLSNDASFAEGDESWSADSRSEYLENSVKIGCSIYYTTLGISVLLILGGIVSLIFYKKKSSFNIKA